MCINCSLLSPVTDEFAEYLGVEKRKYLVVGHSTFDFFEKGYFTGKAFCNDLINYKTIDFFSYPELPNPKIITKDKITLGLYEAKLNVEGSLPIQYKFDGCDKYNELFNGEIKWVDNPPTPPKINHYSGMAKSYLQNEQIENFSPKNYTNSCKANINMVVTINQ